MCVTAAGLCSATAIEGGIMMASMTICDALGGVLAVPGSGAAAGPQSVGRDGANPGIDHPGSRLAQSILVWNVVSSMYDGPDCHPSPTLVRASTTAPLRSTIRSSITIDGVAVNTCPLSRPTALAPGRSAVVTL